MKSKPKNAVAIETTTRGRVEASAHCTNPISKSARKREARIQRLRDRDGNDCFYCRKPIGRELSIEHLVPKCHNGPEHISNLCLAHKNCNLRARNLSVVEKVLLREGKHSKTQAHHA